MNSPAEYRDSRRSSTSSASSGRATPSLPEAPAIPDLQGTTGLEGSLSQLNMSVEQGSGAESGGAHGGLTPSQFTQLVSDLATSTRNTAAQAQSNSAILESLIRGLNQNQASPGSGGPNFNQKTFKDLVLEGSDEAKLDALISWENGVRRICEARNWPDPPKVTVKNLISAIMSAFNGNTERLTQGVSPAECSSLDDFFTKVQKVCLGSAIGSKAYGMFQKRSQKLSEDINAYHSSLKVLFKMAFTTEARQNASQETLKNRFLSGLRDFDLVEKLVERTDCTTLTYDGLRDELLTLMGRSDIKKNLLLLRRGGFPDEPRAAPWVPPVPVPPSPAPAPSTVEPMDWAPVAWVSSQPGKGQRRAGTGSAWPQSVSARPAPQWTRSSPGGGGANPWAQAGPNRPHQQIQLRPQGHLGPSRAPSVGAAGTAQNRPRRSPQSSDDRICYNCRMPGHIARFCDQPTRPRRPQPVQFVDADGHVYVRADAAPQQRVQSSSTVLPRPVQTVVPATASVEDLSTAGTQEILGAPEIVPDDSVWAADVSTVMEGTFPGEPPVGVSSKNARPQ